MSYESGICANCGKKKEEHYSDASGYRLMIPGEIGKGINCLETDSNSFPWNQFQDLGLQRVKENASEVLTAAKDVLDEFKGSDLKVYQHKMLDRLESAIIKSLEK